MRTVDLASPLTLQVWPALLVREIFCIAQQILFRYRVTIEWDWVQPGAANGQIRRLQISSSLIQDVIGPLSIGLTWSETLHWACLKWIVSPSSWPQVLTAAPKLWPNLCAGPLADCLQVATNFCAKDAWVPSEIDDHSPLFDSRAEAQNSCAKPVLITMQWLNSTVLTKEWLDYCLFQWWSLQSVRSLRRQHWKMALWSTRRTAEEKSFVSLSAGFAFDASLKSCLPYSFKTLFPHFEHYHYYSNYYLHCFARLAESIN